MIIEKQKFIPWNKKRFIFNENVSVHFSKSNLFWLKKCSNKMAVMYPEITLFAKKNSFIPFEKKNYEDVVGL